MSDIQIKPEDQPKKIQKPLPLILEIIPGQAGEGLVVVLEPGSFEGSTLRKLCQEALSRTDYSIEERQILEDIERQLKIILAGTVAEGMVSGRQGWDETSGDLDTAVRLGMRLVDD